MNENQSIPAEALYPPGEQQGERMQINELGIAEGVQNTEEAGVPHIPAPPAPAPTVPAPVATAPAPTTQGPPVASFTPKEEVKAQPITQKSGVTYYKGGTEESGILSVDLVIFREQGVETRFLKFVTTNYDKSGDTPKKYELTMTMDSEEKFKEFKAFIADLNWND